MLSARGLALRFERARIRAPKIMTMPRCSMCKRFVESRTHVPFCSSRCQEQDLVNWLDGRYRLDGPPSPDDVSLTIPEAEEN